MTRLETLRNELYEAICDKDAKMTDFRDLCAELFNELGGENKLRALKKEALKIRTTRRGLGTLEELNELIELEKQIDELERYKLWK
jgi:hypothetical protein